MVEREDERKRTSHILQVSQLNPADVFLRCLHRIRYKEELPKPEELGVSPDVFGANESIRQHTRVCATAKLSRALLSCGPSLSSKRLRSLSLILSVRIAGLGRVRGGGKT